MKNILPKNILFLVCLSFFVYPLFSYKSLVNEWFRMEVDSMVSVQFPEQPTPQTINGIQVYTLHTPEAVFLAMTIDQALKPGQNSMTNVHEFYLGIINSMVRNAKATLIDSASFNLKGHQGINFSYTTIKEDGSKLTRSNKAILINNNLYSLLYTPLIQPTESSQAIRKQFLESLDVKD